MKEATRNTESRKQGGKLNETEQGHKTTRNWGKAELQMKDKANIANYLNEQDTDGTETNELCQKKSRRLQASRNKKGSNTADQRFEEEQQERQARPQAQEPGEDTGANRVCTVVSQDTRHETHPSSKITSGATALGPNPELGWSWGGGENCPLKS